MQFIFVFFAQEKSVPFEELIVAQNYIPCFEFCDKMRISILLDKFNPLANKAIMFGRSLSHPRNILSVYDCVQPLLIRVVQLAPHELETLAVLVTRTRRVNVNVGKSKGLILWNSKNILLKREGKACQRIKFCRNF